MAYNQTPVPNPNQFNVTTQTVDNAELSPVRLDTGTGATSQPMSPTAPVYTGTAANQEADGHSQTLGATGDAASANTVIGRLKAIVNALSLLLYTASGNLKVAIQENNAPGSGDQAVVNSTTAGKTKLAVTADPITFASAQAVNVGNFPATQAVKQVKDTARTQVSITALRAAGVTSEGLMSLVKTKDGVSAAAATSIPVTAGKTLRLLAMIVSVRAGAATAPWADFVLRTNPTGAVVVGSPVVAQANVSIGSAIAGQGQSICITLPDGVEFSGSQQVGVTHLANLTTTLDSVTLLGFEY